MSTQNTNFPSHYYHHESKSYRRDPFGQYQIFLVGCDNIPWMGRTERPIYTTSIVKRTHGTLAILLILVILGRCVNNN